MIGGIWLVCQNIEFITWIGKLNLNFFVVDVHPM